MNLALVVDVGGTKMAAALVTPDGTVREHRSRATGTGSGEEVWQPLAELVGEVRAAAGPNRLVGVGVGSAGPIDPVTGAVSPVNIRAWRDFPLTDRLASVVPGPPVRLAGDGACAAAGEHWRGAGYGVDDLLVIVVSTGVGGGLVQGGRLYAGPTGNAGHIGHAVVELDGDACACGGRGCVEAAASGPSMVAWAQRSGWRPDASASGDHLPGGRTRDGRTPDAAQLAASARAGDPIARRAFDRAARALAAGIVSAAAVCDLSRVVIGGGVGQADDLLFPPLRDAIGRYARLGFLRRLSVERARLGTAAGLIGAAALVFHPETYPSTVRDNAAPGGPEAALSLRMPQA